MERFLNPQHAQQNAVEEKLQKQNLTPVISPEELEPKEYVPKFKHTQQDLLYLFNLHVTSETSLNYPWVKDEMYTKVIEELKLGTPNALDYMFKEGLLSKEELCTRGIQELKPYAKTIIQTYKGTRLSNAKKLFIDCGLLTEEETKNRF